jgi:hypothetical protein
VTTLTATRVQAERDLVDIVAAFSIGAARHA